MVWAIAVEEFGSQQAGQTKLAIARPGVGVVGRQPDKRRGARRGRIDIRINEVTLDDRRGDRCGAQQRRNLPPTVVLPTPARPFTPCPPP